MIIDSHTHIFPSFFRNERKLFFPEEPAFEDLYCVPEARLAGRKELLSNMDKEGVNKSIIFGFPWKRPDHFHRHNDYIIESVQLHPDRLIGLCCFDILSREAPKEAERCLASGLSGVGELAVYDSGFSPDIIAALNDIMDVCSQHDVPILIHTNEPLGYQYPGKQPMTLGQLYDLIKRYPSNRIVLAHWGGGIFFYALMKREVRDVLSNVWFDTAASPYLYSPEIYSVASLIIGPEKILFGSDYPLIKPGRYIEEMEAAGLSSQSLKKICGENAEFLLSQS
ncbi:amidohydrolase family protein [Thermodesulfobacteriota bacterium]